MRNHELKDAWFRRQDDGSEGIIFVIIQELTNSPGGRELPFWLLSQQGWVSSCLTKVTTYLRSLLKASLPLREKPAGPDPCFRNIGIAQGREQSVPSRGADVIRVVTERAKCPICSMVVLVIIAETQCRCKLGCRHYPQAAAFHHVSAPQQVLGQNESSTVAYKVRGEKSLPFHPKSGSEMLECCCL